MRRSRRFATPALLSILCLLTLAAAPAAAQDKPEVSSGQTVFVPAYAHVFYDNRASTFDLTTTLNVRNTDPKHPITLLSAAYHDTRGKLVRDYLQKPITIPPLASHNLLAKDPDKTLGGAPCFIVKWKADRQVNAPMVESIMVGPSLSQGISFRCLGRPLAED